MSKKQTVLIVEDEQDIMDLIHFNLLKEGFAVLCANDGVVGYETALKERPDLILLDVMLPGMDGLKVCSMIKKNKEISKTPIIMLTAKGSEEDQVLGFDNGADDYVSKPFSPKVLMARVYAMLRRTTNTEIEDLIEGHGIKIDPEKRKVYLDEELVELTFTEFQILYLLAKKSGKVFSRAQIVDSVRGENHAITDRSVDVQVVGLRKKLGTFGKFIETVRGAGYRFREI